MGWFDFLLQSALADEDVQAGKTSSNVDAKVEPDAPTTTRKPEASVAQQERPRQIRRPISIMRLNLIVLVFILTTSGLVPLLDIVFVVFASVYFFAIGKYVYPSPTNERQPGLFVGSRILGPYIAFAGLVALIIPVAYILGSFVQGDWKAMESASPHLFLTACQVLSEQVVNVSFPTKASLPVRGLVPIFYNTRRLFDVATWVRVEFTRAAVENSTTWLLFGRGLAAANMAIWAFNLFCFLLPIYLPLLMQRHYELERLSKVEHHD